MDAKFVFVFISLSSLLYSQCFAGDPDFQALQQEYASCKVEGTSEAVRLLEAPSWKLIARMHNPQGPALIEDAFNADGLKTETNEESAIQFKRRSKKVFVERKDFDQNDPSSGPFEVRIDSKAIAFDWPSYTDSTAEMDQKICKHYGSSKKPLCTDSHFLTECRPSASKTDLICRLTFKIDYKKTIPSHLKDADGKVVGFYKYVKS